MTRRSRGVIPFRRLPLIRIPVPGGVVSVNEAPVKRQTRRHVPKARQSPAALERLHPHAAGIDCGSAEHFVAVPPDRDPTPVQSVPAFTGDLHRLADWLTACRVTHVAMEATGVCWIPTFEILDARGFRVMLGNARHVKNLPGRKRDVSDDHVEILRCHALPPGYAVTNRATASPVRTNQTLVTRAAPPGPLRIAGL